MLHPSLYLAPHAAISVSAGAPPVEDESLATINFKDGIYTLEGEASTLEALLPDSFDQLEPVIAEGEGARWSDTDGMGAGIGFSIIGDLYALLEDGFVAVMDARIEYPNLDHQVIATFGMEWSNNPVYDTTWGWGSTISTPFNIDHLEPGRITSATYDGVTSSDDEDEMATDIGEGLARVAVIISPTELTISQNGTAIATITPVANPDRNFLTLTTNIYNTGPLPASLVWEKLTFYALASYTAEDLPTLSAVA